MNLNEMFEREPSAYQDLSDDNSQVKLGDLRKTRLTLRQIKKLRQINDIRAVEFKDKLTKIKAQYKPPAEASGGL